MNKLESGQELAIEIGELVIEGGRDVDATGLARAVEGELGRLIAEQGIQPTPAIHARIDAGTLPDGFGDTSGVGRQVAQVVHRTLGGGS